MPKVFVVQESEGKNLLPAEAYGEVVILLPPGQIVFSITPTLRKLRDGLRHFSDEDFIVLMGDPAAIGIACAQAARYNGGRFNMLKWDRQENRYFVVKVDFNSKDL